MLNTLPPVFFFIFTLQMDSAQNQGPKLHGIRLSTKELFNLRVIGRYIAMLRDVLPSLPVIKC